MNEADEYEKLRIEDFEYERAASQKETQRVAGAITAVGQTKNVTGIAYPTVANRFYALAKVGILGAETEGGAGTLTANTDTFFALNLGTAIPPLNSNVICTFTKYRWVFRYDG